MPPCRTPGLWVAVAWFLALPLGAAAQDRLGLGQPATPEQIAGWDIDTRPPGAGLPKGSGTVAQGRELYNKTCVTCHGPDGKGPMDRLTGGEGSLKSKSPAKTVGSYWPYATTLFDYIRRAMPFDHPQSLTTDQVYAAAAYLLHMNGLVPEDATMNAESLPKVKMRNRDGFYGPDPRPDAFNRLCMRN